MANRFLIPKNIVSGKGAIEEAGSYMKDLGTKALIVTDKIMVQIGNVSKVTEMLDNANVEYEIYSDVNREPTDVIVENGIELYKKSNCNFLIGIGGGSPIDAAKAIGAMITNKGHINDYMGKVIKNPIPPFVAVPTTAGTGSEATQFTIIADTKNDIKMLLKGPNLIPTLSVVDAELTMTAPPNVTAATGIDALTHAVESYTSRLAQPLSDTFALSAIKRIFSNLRQACKEEADFEARNQMSLAALEAGIAFNNSSVTIVHGMSRPIGAIFHVPHGISNAVLIGECLEFAIEGATKRFCDIAKTIGIYENGISDMENAKKLVLEIKKLCKDINIPTLEEFGIERKEFFDNIDKMAEDALDSGSPANTKRQPSKEDVIKIYEKLWD